MENSDIVKSIKGYYGETLTSTKDLKTSACCPTGTSLPKSYSECIKLIHPEILNRFYGCGSPIPPLLKDLTVLDLGCGTGRDTFVLSHLVGEEGHVIGVDMTEAQLDLAKKHLNYHAEKFSYKKSNVSFHLGFIEDLKELGIEDSSVDLVTSNCVINLSANKEKVFSEIFRVLKPGGELYFSDIFASCRIPLELQSDPILRGECLSGALYTEDFRRLLTNLGCPDYRTISSSLVELSDPLIILKLGMIEFYSETIRAFKIPLEDRCEDYGQVAYYKGSIPEYPNNFILDNHHEFITNKPMLVCGNTADMLSQSRYSSHFRIEGTKENHFGLFNSEPKMLMSNEVGGGCC